MFYADEALGAQRIKVGMILKSPIGITITQATNLNFKVRNNQAEYKALHTDLILSMGLGVTHLVVYSNFLW